MQTQSEFTSLDPHIGYTWLDYEINAGMCGNLITIEHNSSKIKFRIAKDLTILENGTEFQFTIHDDAAFHNGRRLTADDIVYSINRVTNPKLQSPGMSFFDMLVGYEDYASGKADHIAGVEAISDTKISMKLKHPSRAFLMALTTNFACIVPKEVYSDTEYRGDPVGAGPLEFVSLTDGVLLIKPANGIVNNNFNKFTQIKIETGVDQEEITTSFAQDEVDFLLDGIDWAATSSAEAEKMTANIWGPHGTSFISLNVRKAPLDNRFVRQAINYAINRQRLVEILDGAVLPTAQIVPPALQAHKPDQETNPYDPKKASELLAKAGHPDGLSLNLYGIDSESYRNVAFSIARDLHAIGINTQLHFGTHNETLDAALSPEGVDMVLSDGLAWIADYPDASNFFFPVLSEKALTDGGWNWPGYTNPKAEELAVLADSYIGDDQTNERIETWREVFDIVEDDAPWVPLYHRRMFLLISERAMQPNTNGEFPEVSPFPLFQSLLDGYSKYQE